MYLISVRFYEMGDIWNKNDEYWLEYIRGILFFSNRNEYYSRIFAAYSRISGISGSSSLSHMMQIRGHMIFKIGIVFT